MDVEQITQQLQALDAQQRGLAPDSPAFISASHEVNRILFQDMNVKEFAFIVKNMGRQMTITDEARLVVAAHEGRLLTEAVPLPARAEAAFAVRHSRKEKGYSQTQLAKLVGLTQSQIAKIENATTSMTVEVLQRIMQALGQSYLINPMH